MGCAVKRIFIGKGQVGHSRHEFAENSFRYSAFFLFFNCADEESLWTLLKTRFRRGRSLRSEDYLDGCAGPLLTCAQTFLLDRCGRLKEQHCRLIGHTHFTVGDVYLGVMRELSQFVRREIEAHIVYWKIVIFHLRLI